VLLQSKTDSQDEYEVNADDGIVNPLQPWMQIVTSSSTSSVPERAAVCAGKGKWVVQCA
jgi:hypothetical protein